MIPVLFNSDVKVFDNNGIGKLSSADDCTVIEALNSKFELELKYPVKGLHFGHIQHGSIILSQPAPEVDPQPFRVYRITKPMNGRVTVYAKHLAYDNAGITTGPFSVAGPKLAFQAMKQNAAIDCPFTFTTDIESTKIIAAKVPTDIWTILGNGKGSMLDVVGGEYLFDGYSIKLLQKRGQDRGIKIKYGKNLTSLEQDENISNCYTAVHPYWTNSDGAFVQLSEKIIQCEGNYGYVRILPLDLSKVFEDKPTQAQIREYTAQYIVENDVGKPITSLKVSYTHMDHKPVYLGDTVSVDYCEIGVSVKARVCEVRYKPLLGRYENISIGDVKPNMASTIAAKPNKSYADNAAQNAAQSAVDAQTQKQIFDKLTNGGAAQGIFMGEDGKVYLNITYAVTGTLNAGKVTVKNLSAGSMNAGKLSAKDGMSYFDLDSGEFVSVDANQNATIIKGGAMWLETSAGKKKMWMLHDSEHAWIYLFDDDGNIKGGVGVGHDHFMIMAPDETLDGQITGRAAVWKTIDGNRVLAASS